MEMEQIKQAVHAALDERDGLDRERHRADHDWTFARRQREQLRARRRDEMCDKIKATVIGGLTVSLFIAIGTVLTKIGLFVIDLYQKSQAPH